MAAVEKQFDCVLMRKPTKEELAKYVDLLRSSIQLAGNSAGLRQMLFAVLLESDFLYRLELGGGEPDEFGRRKLTRMKAAWRSPRPGDRSPDPELSKAGQGAVSIRKTIVGKSSSACRPKLLQPLDHKISGKNIAHKRRTLRSSASFANSSGIRRRPRFSRISSAATTTTKTRAVAPWAPQVPDQGSRPQGLVPRRRTRRFSKTPDHRRVFRLPRQRQRNGERDRAGGGQKAKRMKGRYSHRGDGFSKHQVRSVSVRTSAIMRYMHLGNDRQGATPLPRLFAHGYYYNHSVFYNPAHAESFPVTEGENKTTRAGRRRILDYPVEQPFEFRSARVAYSPRLVDRAFLNFHTDPIKLDADPGKLLAGSVPGGPITVTRKYRRILIKRCANAWSRSRNKPNAGNVTSA